MNYGSYFQEDLVGTGGKKGLSASGTLANTNEVQGGILSSISFTLLDALQIWKKIRRFFPGNHVRFSLH